jgi:2-polyprenyl-6-methoxyphenol hydroxylase-like FAD-dependent oxidoreductase
VARIAFIGGGIGGLIGALLLARDGHHVTVLERDGAGPVTPADAFDQWSRRGVPQFRLPHVLLPRLREILDDTLPDVIDALITDGAVRTNRMTELPATITGGIRPGDQRFEQVIGRRPMVEATLARVADREPGVAVRRGAVVAGLLSGEGRPGGVPHVAGVVLDSGEPIRSDLVVVAGGRRAALPAMLEAIGAERPTTELADHGFTYYCRAFCSSDGTQPMLLGPPLQHYESLTFVTVGGDNGTWSIAVIASAEDRWMRRATDAEVWSRIVAAYPLLAHWLDGEPITGVETMSATPDRRTWYVLDGRPVATGVVALGDALASTSPMYGRGMTFAAMQALCLRDVLREVAPTDLDELAHRWNDRVNNVVMPFVDDTISMTRHRLAEIDLQRAGHSYETADPAWHFVCRLFAATTRDPDVLRAAMGVAAVFDRPGDIGRRPTLRARLDELGDLPAPPGPTRAELESIVDTRTVTA